MIASTLWVRMFFEKSLPGLFTLGLNYAFAYTTVTSDNVGMATLLLALALSVVNVAMMCRQRALAEAFISNSDPLFKKAVIGLQNVVFSLFSGIGMTMVAITPLLSGETNATTISAALLSAGLIMFWSNVFIRASDIH